MKSNNHSEILDSKLASESQQAVRKVVQALPEDTLSMAWRSALNERILAESMTRKPRIRLTWFAMPAAGVAVAATLAMFVFLHAPTSSNQIVSGPESVMASNGSVEVGLLDTYRQESVAHEILGSGPEPSSDAAKPSIVDVAADSYNSEVDPDSL